MNLVQEVSKLFYLMLGKSLFILHYFLTKPPTLGEWSFIILQKIAIL